MSTSNEAVERLCDAAVSYSVAIDVDEQDRAKVDHYRKRLLQEALRYAAGGNGGLSQYLQRLCDAVDALNHAEAGGGADSPQSDNARRVVMATAVAVAAEWRR